MQTQIKCSIILHFIWVFNVWWSTCLWVPSQHLITGNYRPTSKTPSEWHLAGGWIISCPWWDASNHRPASETPSQWRLAGGPIIASDGMLAEIPVYKGLTLIARKCVASQRNANQFVDKKSRCQYMYAKIVLNTFTHTVACLSCQNYNVQNCLISVP